MTPRLTQSFPPFDPTIHSNSVSDPASDFASASDQLPSGSWLGRYQIARLIGRGGMGCVYEAIHGDLGKRVAIKILLPALAASAEARGRFLREGQAAARIRHPHVVDVTDVVADGATTYLVMEYLEGEDLAARIGRAGALSLGETADILLPVLAAIAAAHQRGVIHRDLKPENVFLARGAQGGPCCPKVVDFGISKVLGDPGALALTATSTAFGTLYYLPPELLRGAREADARSDQYALGAILYECLTGTRAFDGDGIYAILKSIAEGTYAPARSLRPDLPPEIEDVVNRALSVDPAARFPSLADMGGALLEFTSPTVRAQWAVLAAGEAGEAGEAAQARSPSGTWILPDGVAGDGGRRTAEPRFSAEGDDRALPCDASAEVIPARSWTPPLVLIGVAIGLVVVAAASVRSPTGTVVKAPVAQTRGPAHGTGGEPAARPVKGEGAARRVNPAPAPATPPAQPSPSNTLPVPPPAPVHRHRIHLRFAHSAPRTSAPILD
jgi:eukaryotic-like serine/threonine-protein kinase